MTTAEHKPWCESFYVTTTAPYNPKPCNCGAVKVEQTRIEAARALASGDADRANRILDNNAR